MAVHETILATAPVLDAFAQLGVRYYLGGSVASSAHGVARSTLDTDVVADLALEHVAPLVGMLRAAYYIHEPAVREAVLRRASFNVIHLATSFKVDVFILKSRLYDHEAMRRRQLAPLAPEDPSQEFFLATPEDVVLAKLEWYRLGDEVSERQWADVVGVMKVQRQALDREYLRRWAGEVGVTNLLARAWTEVEGGG